MKTLILAAIILFVSAKVYSQTTYTTDEAKNHVGETAMVKGKVFDVFTTKSGTVLINFDNKFPNQTFTAVVKDGVTLDISAIKAGVTLTVSGEIKSFKEKPEIILETQDQIVKVE